MMPCSWHLCLHAGDGLETPVRIAITSANKRFTFAFKEAPFLQANRGDHVDDQIEQIVCFSCFFFCV